MQRPALAAVDWGTTSCRAALVDRAGAVMATREGGAGILAVTDGGFDTALQTFLAPWADRIDGVPVLLSGMIGSRQGWREAPYVRCPAGMDEVAAKLTWIDSARFGRIGLVPGLDDHASGTPDVMRGEEVQIFGALGAGSGLCVLPGTHSKWARVETGRIVSFRSFMTGEVFAALRDHTILGRLMTHPTSFHEAAFLAGVHAGGAPGGPGALLNRIFSARTLGLFDHLPGDSLADYLSGVLIGAEVADNTTDTIGPVHLIGSVALTARYATACPLLGVSVAPPVDNAAARGTYLVARAANLIGA